MESLTLKVTATDTSGLSASETFAVAVPAAGPTVTDQTANQTWTQGQKVSFALPSNTFTDPQGQALTYRASQSNGAALPSWLSFNAATRTFSGTIPGGMEGLTLKVSVTDTSGLSASETFGVTVPAAAPSLAHQTANQIWQQGQKISLALPTNSFTDPQGETLTYKASQANGAALPAWLGFNTVTDSFSGTVPSGLENLTLKVTATDTSGLSASETFGVTVPAASSSAGASAATNGVAARGDVVAIQATAHSSAAMQFLSNSGVSAAALPAGVFHLDLAAVAGNGVSYAAVSDQGNALSFNSSPKQGGSLAAILGDLSGKVSILPVLTNHGAMMFA
jgi:hypothetical protein